MEDSTSIILKPPKNSLNRLSEKTAGQQIQKFTFSQVNDLSLKAFKLFIGGGGEMLLDFYYLIKAKQANFF